jgi:pteridine reductase
MAENPRKTALVTGAAHRIGRATALALAQDGMDVVLHHRRSGDAARSLAREIEGMGRSAWSLKADFADRAQTARFMQEAVDLAGPIHLLINNASIFEPSRVGEFSAEELDLNIQVNAFAPLVLSRAFAAQDHDGVIINFLDSTITGCDGSHAAYHLSKSMLHSLTRMLAFEWAPRIRVNAVAPGLILPPSGMGQDYLDRKKKENPMNRSGTLAGVIDAVRFLVKSEFVTGQVIFVDGGRHLLGPGPGQT